MYKQIPNCSPWDTVMTSVKAQLGLSRWTSVTSNATWLCLAVCGKAPNHRQPEGSQCLRLNNNALVWSSVCRPWFVKACVVPGAV